MTKYYEGTNPEGALCFSCASKIEWEKANPTKGVCKCPKNYRAVPNKDGKHWKIRPTT